MLSQLMLDMATEPVTELKIRAITELKFGASDCRMWRKNCNSFSTLNFYIKRLHTNTSKISCPKMSSSLLTDILQNIVP